MFSVALIGADGAGKTTIANRLLESFPKPMEYLYMGINIESSNVALPTSRLIEKLKKSRNGTTSASKSLHDRANKKKKKAGSLWAAIRLFNRIAEEWYRQYLAWRYRREGRIVIFDRHFQFDFERNGQQDQRFTDRLHRWLLAKFYPSPDLVIFLDAPGEVLYARKGEATVEYLEGRRQAFLKQGEITPNFVCVDATQSIDAVYEQVSQLIQKTYDKFRR